ncbi:alpha/beta fold hydrolase [Hyphomicrobium sp. CS1GBMeth3]|uniref:alpha/beta hydrolase n=1 Tax=Hyphomicrobium sp. CS1GBMeth3 TaxID=1892845 RepID=UPI0009301A25|nr:alpha/beta fold hydrolase [Hyphomicrobium sp. CS1GBMeth3]
MSLEVLHAPGQGPARSVDILLVHGIFVGAWVWEPHFMPYLAEAGYNVHAVSLRGHGGSCGDEQLAALALTDYTADLQEAVAAIPRPIVAVGHSMGGAVVQHAIRSGVSLAGAALMASVPPGGLMATNVAMMWSQPLLWRELSSMFTSENHSVNLEVLRGGLFSDRVDVATLARFMARTGRESALIGFELQGLRPFAPFAWQAPPILVMAGTDDRFIRQQDVWATALWYGVEPQWLPGLSHTVMLDPDWRIAADSLLKWLDGLEAEATSNVKADAKSA